MSISEQVKELRDKADVFERSGCAVDRIVKAFRKAANTIESLSKKLQAANMERAAECDGWIPRNVRLPEKEGEYWISYSWGSKECVDISNFREGKFEFEVSVKTVIDAWKPCIFPEPYHEP